MDNMVLPHQEVKISDYVDLDLSEKWDPQLYGEIQTGTYTEEGKFASLPKTLSSLNDISPLMSGSYSDTKDLKAIQRDIFIKRTMAGLKIRLAANEIPDAEISGYLSRVDMEMSTLIDMQFDGYMLDVQGFLDTLKTKLDGETGPGRGSAAGSLVAYALRITNVDPIQHDLIFERFLNKERVSWPDIDMDMQGKQMTLNKVVDSDLPQEFKDIVLAKYANKNGDKSNFDDELAAKDLLTLWLKARYGREHVKNILTKGTYGAKRAIETICKNYGNEYALSVNPNYKNFGGQAYMHLATDIKGTFFEKVGSNIKDALESEDFSAVYNSSPAMAQVIDEALELEGTLSTFGVHAAGALKSAKERTWVQVATMNIDGEETSPIPGKKIEDEVDIKFDFLGLKTLLVIRDCIDIVNKVDGVDLADEIYNKANYINDKKAYEQIRSGDLEGLFQIESSGMKQLAKKLQPDCFEDIVAMLALFRPGPLESGMVDDFIERKHGRQEIDYFDESLEPALKPILENTYGVIVYQEQVMKIVQEIGGFTLGDADLVRRAMGKKIPEEMDKLKGDFVKGALKKGYKQQIASDLFDLIVKFAGYGFNKSHSAAYAFVTMQTAMLKANHKKAFYTALVIDKSSTIENLESIIPEILKSGIEVGSPDINVSYVKPQLRNDKIYYGLDTIKGTKTSDIKTIIESRDKNGDFKDLNDLMSRSDVVISKSTFEGLVRSGALDSLSSESIDFDFPNKGEESILTNRASMIFWFENFTKAKAPTKTQLTAMMGRYEENSKLSSAQDSEYKILGSILSGIDRKLKSPINFEEIKSMPENAVDGSTKIIGDATIIDVVSGVNKFGKFYQITLLDSQNRRQNFSLSKPQIKAKDDRNIELKAGDVVQVTINKSINVENDTVHTSLKDINLYNEDLEFMKIEVLGADIFTVKDLDASKLKGSDPISLNDLDEHMHANQSYHNGKKSAKYTYFLKSFQQTAKKTGYVLEVSDGENNTKVFVSGVSNIDEHEFSNNINLPITLEFNKYEQDFVMTKYNSKPELPGVQALTASAKDREDVFVQSLGAPDSRPAKKSKKTFKAEAYNNGSTIFVSGLTDDTSRALELETNTKVYGNRVYYNNQSQKKQISEKLIEFGFDNLDLPTNEVVEVVDKIKYPAIFTTSNSSGDDVVFSRSDCLDIIDVKGNKYLKYSSEDNSTSIWFNKSDATCGNISQVQATDAEIQALAEPLQIEIRGAKYPPVKSRLADKAQSNIKNKSKEATK
jgi:DNA polymerase III alpha subunit